MIPGDSKAVENLFNDVAYKYDFLNDLLSIGLHRVWKRQLLMRLSPLEGENWLDLCCGTGDMALAIARRVQPSGKVLGIDYAIKPLSLASKRSDIEPSLPVSWIKRDAMDTGLPSDQFDGAVMAYGLRNLSAPGEGLKELHRVLKPEARAGILDFNPIRNDSIGASFQKFYLRKIVVPIASKFGLREHYVYLEQSLKSFPPGNIQEDLAIQAGFSEAKHIPIALGQMGLLMIKA